MTMGVARIYSPEDGHDLGLQGMIDDMLETCRANLNCTSECTLDQLQSW